MKTSIELPNGLWETAKKHAVERRISLSQLIEEALTEHLKGGEKVGKKS